jgi:chromosome segregation ATPase
MSKKIGKEQHKLKLKIKKLEAEKINVEFQLNCTEQEMKQLRREYAVGNKKMISQMNMDRRQWESTCLKLEEKMAEKKDDFKRSLKHVQSNLKSVRSHNEEQGISINQLNLAIEKHKKQLSKKNLLVEKLSNEINRLRRVLSNTQ